MKKFFSLIALLAGVLVAHAQETNTAAEPAFIEVRGHAERYLIPDEIYLSIRLLEEKKDPESVDKQTQAIQKLIEELGIAPENLSLKDSQGNMVRISWGKHELVKRSQLILKLSSAEEVVKVMNGLDELGIHRVSIYRVDHSQRTEIQKEVNIEAIQAAKNKADYLLEAIGHRTGKPLIVSDDLGSHSLASRTAGINVRGSRSHEVVVYETPIVKQTTLNFQKIKISAAYYVKFEVQ